MRELQNCIERAVILCDGEQILTHHLNLTAHAIPAERSDRPWDHVDLTGTLADVVGRVQTEVERLKITRVLGDVGGDRGQAADQLKVGYGALLAKLKEHGLG